MQKDANVRSESGALRRPLIRGVRFGFAKAGAENTSRRARATFDLRESGAGIGCAAVNCCPPDHVPASRPDSSPTGRRIARQSKLEFGVQLPGE
jgi:hypothetical protein